MQEKNMDEHTQLYNNNKNKARKKYTVSNHKLGQYK